MPINIFAQMINDLSQLGFFEFLLPWLFAFAIVFGLLIKAHIFGDANKKVSGVLAIVIAFFVAAFAGPQMAAYFTVLFAGFSTVAAAILVVVLLVALVGIDISWNKDKKHAQYGAIAVLVVIGIVLFLIAMGTSWLQWTLWSNTWVTTIFVLVLILGAVAFVMYGDEDKKQTTGSSKTG